MTLFFKSTAIVFSSSPYSLPITLLAAAAVVAWIAAPAPTSSTSGPATTEAWEPPKTQASEPAKWIAVINQHKLWGVEVKNAAAGADEDKGWNIVGVVIDGNDTFALIRIGDRPSEQYRAGDLTPDGAKILNIEEDRLHVLDNGKNSILEIYRK